MANYRDRLGREFIELKACAEVVGKSDRQMQRDVRKYSISDTKEGKTRYLLIDDIERIYGVDRARCLFDKSTFETKIKDIDDVENDVIDVSENSSPGNNFTSSLEDFKENINEDIPTKELQSVQQMYNLTENYLRAFEEKVGRLEKGLGDLHSVERDWDSLNQKLDYQRRLIKKIRHPKMPTSMLIIVVISCLALAGLFYYGFVVVDNYIQTLETRHKNDISDMNTVLSKKEKDILTLIETHKNSVVQYEAALTEYKSALQEYKQKGVEDSTTIEELKTNLENMHAQMLEKETKLSQVREEVRQTAGVKSVGVDENLLN